MCLTPAHSTVKSPNVKSHRFNFKYENNVMQDSFDTSGEKSPIILYKSNLYY